MDKPFRTIAEQIEILEGRGVATDASTKHVLEREGYYSVVNGYKELFVDKEATQRAGHDVFRAGTAFSDLYRLYRFDRDLRMTMLRYFAMAEATLKTVCAYHFALEHQDQLFAYTDASNYREEPEYRKRIERLVRSFDIALGRDPRKPPKRKDYMEHYLAHHDEVPVWVVLRYMNLGEAFKFFEFQKAKTRNEIARAFSALYAESHSVPVKLHDRKLRLIYDHVKDFRNICAHDERLFCARVAPSKDIALAGVMDDLGLILPKSHNLRLVREVVDHLLKVVNDIGEEYLPVLMRKMGIKSLDRLFLIRE